MDLSLILQTLSMIFQLLDSLNALPQSHRTLAGVEAVKVN